MLVGEAVQRTDLLRRDFRDELSVAAVPLAVTLLRQCTTAPRFTTPVCRPREHPVRVDRTTIGSYVAFARDTGVDGGGRGGPTERRSPCTRLDDEDVTQ
jgi:hypothetical protein